jgi:hypothetical protein
MRRTMKDLRDDQQGAVMLTGLFLAFFLVGALWYLIGIGDAIVFRNRMQEAADSAAFSTAALHAKGMNFISVCNIMMLIMCAVHIILGVIQDATIAACLLTGVGCLSVRPAMLAYHNTSRLMKIGISATSYLSSVTAIAVPFAATVRSYRLGGEYGNQGRVGNLTVIAIGPSTIPYAVGGIGLIGIPGLPPAPAPLGLPVRGEKYNELCKRVGDRMVGTVFSVIPGDLSEFAADIIGEVAGSFFRFRYCNDMMTTAQATVSDVQNKFGRVETRVQAAEENERQRQNQGRPPAEQTPAPERPTRIDSTSSGGTRRPGGIGGQGWMPWFDPGFDRGWGDEGFLVTTNSAQNGTLAYQIWALTWGPSYLDTSERRVSIAGSIGRGGTPAVRDSEKGPEGFGYFAQAEFYYDCSRRWRDDTCDGGLTDYNTSFGISWRARLRRLDAPSMGTLLRQYATRGSRTELGDRITDGLRNIGRVDRIFESSTLGAVAIDTISSVITDHVVMRAQREGYDWWQRNYGSDPGIPEASH